MKSENKAFTIIEILVVVVILGILATLTIVAISTYVEKGKNDYDEKLEKQLLISGKNYFADNTLSLPENGATSYVTLAELRGLNIVSKDFIDSYGTKCSNSNSLVQVSNNKGKYTYNACLYCEGNEKFNEYHLMKCNQFNKEIDLDEDKTCNIEKDSNGKYIVYGKKGKQTKGLTAIEAIKNLKENNCTVQSGVCGNYTQAVYGANEYIYYWVNNKGEFVDENEFLKDKVCNPEPPASCSFNIVDRQNYKKIITENKITDESNLISTSNNSLDIKTLNKQKQYNVYYIKPSVLDAIKQKSEKNTMTPSYVSDGSSSTNSNYFYEANKNKLVRTSTVSYIHHNKAIPSEYTFLIGKPKKAVYSFSIPSSIKMSTSNIKKWGSEYSSQVKKAVVIEANKKAINNYKVRYDKVGTYNGEYVDVVMTLTGYSGCKLRRGASVCGLWFESDKLGVYSLGINHISVQYNFYKTGTNKSIKVKGYTTYWDIDANQGIHFVKNTTGLYVYGSNKLYVRTINSAPYIYEYSDDKYIGYNGNYAITETFYGTSMRKTFSFASGNDGDHSKITGSSGEIWHSTYPVGITKSYLNSSENSVFENEQIVEFKIRYSNATEKKQTFKVTDTLKGMTYVPGSATNSNGTKVSPKISGDTLTWSGTISAFKSEVITYKVKINSSSCGDLVKTYAKMTLGGTNYSTDILQNSVVCPTIKKCEQNQ